MTAQTLESPDEAAQSEPTVDADAVDTGGEGQRNLRIQIPPDATEREATAIASAVSAHVSDLRRVAAVARDRGEADYVSGWKLAGRLDVDRRRRLPRDVERGDVWKTAGRSW